MQYYAHKDKKERLHKLSDHSLNTASLAAQFASVFGASDLAYMAGLNHDVGKYSLNFQKRLKGENIQVDHATASDI